MRKIGILFSVLVIAFLVSLRCNQKEEAQEETLVQEASVVQKEKESEVSEEVKEEEKNDETGSYEDFARINDDVVFVLHFEDKDLPVVDANDNDYYLRKDLNLEYCSMGTVFMDANCSVDSKNVILYGHSSNNNELRFTFLKNYLNEEYAQSHRIVRIEKQREEKRLQVFAAFSIDLNQDDFREWMKCQWRNDDEFLKTVDRLKSKSAVDFDVEVKYNDQIYTLVTCDLSCDNGRILVFLK